MAKVHFGCCILALQLLEKHTTALATSGRSRCGQNDITLTMNYVRPGDGEVLFFTEKRSGISERSIELTPSACFANQVINERTWNEQVGILIYHNQSIKGELIADNTRNISTHEESRCLHSFDLSTTRDTMMMTRTPTILSLACLATTTSAFLVQSKKSALTIAPVSKSENDLAFNPLDGLGPIDMERAHYCAEHFGECSVEEMEELFNGEILHDDRLLVLLTMTQPSVLPFINLLFRSS